MQHEAGSTPARYGPPDEIAWYSENSGSGVGTHEVGRKRPNGFSLHDMLGNVSEWVNDRFGVEYWTGGVQRLILQAFGGCHAGVAGGLLGRPA